MPRKAKGPHLRIFGPDTKHGARRIKGFKSYCWYIVFRKENGQEGQHAVPDIPAPGNREDAERYMFEVWYPTRRLDHSTEGEAVTVGQVLETYYQEHAVQSGKVAAPEAIMYRKDNLKKFFMGGCEDVSPQGCRDYVQYRRDECGVRLTTIISELKCLRAAFMYCKKENRISSVPSFEIPQNQDNQRERWLTRSEAAALIRAARKSGSQHLVLFILIGLYTGQRKEAILRLQWHQNPAGGYVDLQDGKIYWRKEGRQTTKRQPKAQPINHRLARFLGYAKRRTNSFYVINWNGERIKRINKAFGTAARNAGLNPSHYKPANDEGANKRVTPHTLCHTCITWLLRQEVPVWDVAGFVGKSEDMIREVYGHHCPDHMERAARALG